MPKSVFQPPRGTRDFLPEEVEFRRRIEQKIRETFERYGFREVITPIFEHFELYSARSGEEIREEMYVFRGKRRERGRPPEYVLRPELTAPICRMYISGGLSTWPKPVKVYYVGRCFRYDRPGPGRYREFWQAGVELIGSPYPEADAEVIALAVDALEAVGLEGYEVRIGHLGVLRGILEEAGLDVYVQNKLIKALDDAVSDLGKLEVGERLVDGRGNPLTKSDVMANLERQVDALGIDESLRGLILDMVALKGEREATMEKAREIFKDSEKAQKSLEQLNEILTLLEAYGVKEYLVDLSIARGLDYYTGMVFEIDLPRLGAQKQICGGGRYDNLISDYGGPATPATGFALGFDRIAEALKTQKKEEKTPQTTDAIVAAATDNLRTEAIKITQELRRQGIKAETDLMRRSLTNALSHADKKSTRYAIIIGEKEQKQGKITIKDMKTRKQKTTTLQEAIHIITKKQTI